jgi:molecular chaperone GrpE (heat shock protein)
LGAARIGEIQVELNETVYDPAVHEALAGAALTRPDLPENTIVKLDRRGFFYEGKVLRRALVTLSCRGK